MPLNPPRYPRYTGSEPCRSTDPEVFFPDRVRSREEQAAVRICQGCEIKQQCAEYAVWHEGHGVWGGLTTMQRHQIRKQQGIILSSESRQSVA